MRFKLYILLLSLIVNNFQASASALNSRKHVICENLKSGVFKFFDLQENLRRSFTIRPQITNVCKSMKEKSFFIREFGVPITSESCIRDNINDNWLTLQDFTTINITQKIIFRYTLIEHKYFRIEISHDNGISEIYHNELNDNSTFCGFFLWGKCIRLCEHINKSNTIDVVANKKDIVDKPEYNSTLNNIVQKLNKAMNDIIEFIKYHWNQNPLSKLLIILICLTLISAVSFIFLELRECCCCRCCFRSSGKTPNRVKGIVKEKNKIANIEELHELLKTNPEEAPYSNENSNHNERKNKEIAATHTMQFNKDNCIINNSRYDKSYRESHPQFDFNKYPLHTSSLKRYQPRESFTTSTLNRYFGQNITNPSTAFLARPPSPSPPPPSPSPLPSPMPLIFDESFPTYPSLRKQEMPEIKNSSYIPPPPPPPPPRYVARESNV
nr:MAG: hypothetical protein [Porcellio scaber clopovirus]